MKDWFDKLKDKHKILLIIVSFLSVYLFVGLSQLTEFFLLFCVASLFFTCIFTVYFVMYKISSRKKKTSYYQNLTTPQSVSSDTSPQTEQPVKKPEINTTVRFDIIDDDYVLRWHYKENIALVQNLDKVEFKGSRTDDDIRLVPEPDNQYDENAVALYKGEYKLGYFYKGRTQNMILSYLNCEDYLIKTVVCFLDRENNKLAVRIAFYRKLDAFQLSTLTVPLTKITQKAEAFESSRYDNVSEMDIDDCVEITGNDYGRYTICNEYGYELGELSASTSEKVEEIFSDIIYAKIADIQLMNNDTYKVMISIFYR